MGFSNANPFAAHEIATRIKECIEPYLEGTTQGLPPRRCVHVGAIAWDDCECGQLIVALTDGGEVVSFDDQQNTKGRRGCGPKVFTWNITVSMLRCAPIGEGSAPPPCEELDAAARVSIEDAWAIRAGVICCLFTMAKTRLPNGSTEILDFTLGRQTFVGPQGMCQGSELPITIAMNNGCYPCDIS